MHLKKIRYLLLFIFLINGALMAGKGNPGKGKTASPANITTQYLTEQAQQGFNLKLWLSNQMTMGEEAWEPYLPPLNGCSSVQGIGMEYPAGSCIEHLCGLRLEFGGIIDGIRHVSSVFNGYDGIVYIAPEKQDTIHDKIWKTHTGPEEYHPNSDGYSGYYCLHNIQVNRRGYDDDGDGRIDEDELDGKDNDGDWNPLIDDIGADGLPDSLEVSCNGLRYDPVTNPDPAYDNFDPTAVDSCHPVGGVYKLKNDKLKYTQNNGIPDHGEPHVDEDYGAVSDNDLYISATDTLQGYFYHFPMGIRVFQKTYAWRDPSLSAFIPMDFIYVNAGKDTIDGVYLGFVPDFDVGPVSVPAYYGNNYACYAANLRCGYVDNPIDSGSTPAGLVLLGAPKSLDSLHYVWQWAEPSDTSSSNDWSSYSFMTGELFGDSSVASCQPSTALTDTRFAYCFGPFGTMHPGDTLKISVALVSGSSIIDMLNNAQKAHDLYANNYVLGVDDEKTTQPVDFRLEQNYPNPFNPSTTIIFDLPRQSVVTLKVYNILGQEVATIVHNEAMQVGRHQRVFDATGLSSGVYFYKMTAGEFTETSKMILLK
jgi:hypothetical protein